MDADGRRQDRFEELDGYRGVAALAVAVYHVHILHATAFGVAGSGGLLASLTLGNFDAGVDWFFVLSGFLIFLPFARAAIAQGLVPSLRRFFLRRAARIIPAYYCVLLIAWLVSTQGRGDWRDLVEHLSFAYIASGEHLFTLVPPGWSVAVEVIFYLAVGLTAPLVYRLCGAVATPRRRVALLLGGCLALASASVAYKLWLWSVGARSATLYFGPLARADNFVFGMILAVALAAPADWLRVGPGGARRLRAAALTLTAAVFLLRFAHPLLYLSFHTLCGLAFALLLASTVLGPAGSRWAGRLARPLPRFLGTVSYGVYLWHGPLLENLREWGSLRIDAARLWPNIALLLGLSLALATVSYYALEAPILRAARKYPAAPRAATPASLAAGDGVPTVARTVTP